MAMNTEKPQESATGPNASPAPRSEDDPEQTPESPTLDGARHSWIVDCTEETIKAGEGGFGIVGGVRIPPRKKWPSRANGISGVHLVPTLLNGMFGWVGRKSLPLVQSIART